MGLNVYQTCEGRGKTVPLLQILLLLALTAFLTTGTGQAARAEHSGEDAEWTVMFYFCGSDLESRYSYATGNLEEIASCYPYAAMRNFVLKEELETPDTTPAGVNVVIETGGSREWHAQALGMDIAADRLQRWEYAPAETVDSERGNSFLLRAECPLASMADPETLSDFIRWSAEHYPAEKYALVLWGHGLGSQGGVLVDELFDLDTMRLDELTSALAEGGVDFETLLFDACMMANLETACAVKEHARWMVASEELVAGQGTAIEEWLQQLYYDPEWDGRRLGKTICDANQRKFANQENDQAIETMTWSVIDLSRIDPLAECMDRLFRAFGKCYETDAARAAAFISFFDNTWQFGEMDGFYMLDLGSTFDHAEAAARMDRELRRGILDALEEAVVYSVRGAGRYGASGLSICNATRLSPEELEIYAQNCPFADYLALLDAINPGWSAPDWVYTRAERLRKMEEIEAYQVRGERIIQENGVPGLGFSIREEYETLGNIYVKLYRLNPETGNILLLGVNRAEEIDFDPESDRCAFALPDFGIWPAVEGIHCDLELLWDSGRYRDYLIPIRMGTDIRRIRCQYDRAQDKSMWITGLWEGYDVEAQVSSRGALSLSEVAGMEFSFLYPIEGSAARGETKYESSAPMTMYRMLEISDQPLPAGTYYLEYDVEDLFYRLMNAGRAEVFWDGEHASVPDPEAWQGTILLTP